MDRMYIRDLALRCVVGVRPEERAARQDVTVHVTLECDLARAARTDRTEDAVDLCALEARIAEFVERSAFFLIERLAEGIAALCLDVPNVRAATVAVEKPRALRFAHCAAAEIRRERARGPARRRRGGR